MKDKQKKKKWILFLPIILFMVGAAVFLYPFCTNIAYRKTVQKQKVIFEQQVQEEMAKEKEETIEEKPLEELYQELRRRNEVLYQERQKKLTGAGAYEQPEIDLTEYGLSDNRIGFLMIPKMDIELPILLGANQDNMARGAVHLTETSYPIGGENTNCVIAAHRGYSKTAMFRDIEELEIGDQIYIENFRECLAYKVTEIKVISPTDIEQLLIQEKRDMVTLITCHPYGYNYQRYVVFCERNLEKMPASNLLSIYD